MKIIKRGETKNYSLFSMATGNRQYKESHAVELANTIKANNMLKAFPVLCKQQDGKLFVIDGQHRIGACKILKIEVPYVVVSGVVETDIALINGSQKQWAIKDYLNHFCALGYGEYKKLEMFIIRTKMPTMMAVKLLTKNKSINGIGQTETADFKRGFFKVVETETAEKIYSVIQLMKKNGCSFACDRSIVGALQRIFEAYPEFDASRLVARMKYMDFKKRASWMDYCEQIEEFYNYRSPISCRVHIMSMLSDAGLLKK